MLAKTLFILTGCTGVGKTEISLEVAEKINAEIVSCDSLLVYKGLDIGTAKPTNYELSKIVHHCVNIVEPRKEFDISAYIKHAKNSINDIISREKNVLIVGGAGFYLKSFFTATVDAIEIAEEVENFVQKSLDNNEFHLLAEKLLLLNNGNIDIDLKNPRRVASALKRCMSSRLTHGEIKRKFSEQQCEFYDYKKCTILLARDDMDLKQRIEERVKMMINSGLVEEVQSLLWGDQFNRSNINSIGYRETINWLKHRTNVELLREGICASTAKLIKKQRVWFKKQIPIDHRINLSQCHLSDAVGEIIQIFSAFRNIL